MDLGLEGDTALVTASSSGLGLACAKALAREGANVTICGRTPERLDAAGGEIEAYGFGDVMTREADVTDPDDVTDLVETTVEAYGSLDHVVTSAGGVPSGPFSETDDRDWYAAYDTLVMSVVWTAWEAEEYLKASDAGTFTAITSTTVREVIDSLVLSNAVRRGVTGLVKTLAVEWAPEVRANTVLPGAHETQRIADLIDQGIERGEFADYDEGRADWADPIPMDRLGDPMELGDTVAFLASDRASFVNGAAVPVDGGTVRS